MKYNGISTILFISTIVFILIFVTQSSAEWMASLQWQKIPVADGMLIWSDQGPHTCDWDNHELRRIEFYDWNADPTGISLDFTGHVDWVTNLLDETYVAVETRDDSMRVSRYQVFDRLGNTVLDIAELDSLNPRMGYVTAGTDRLFNIRCVADSAIDFRVLNFDGSLVCSVVRDSACSGSISVDGQRLFVNMACFPSCSNYFRYKNGLEVYSVDTCDLMYLLPYHVKYPKARDVDVIGGWSDSILTVYSGGVAQGTIDSIVGVDISPDGTFAVGFIGPPQEIALYDLGTMTKLWGILDTSDSGEQLIADIASNGVVLYWRDLEIGGRGITVVDPDGMILYESDFPDGVYAYLGGDGDFFVIDRFPDHQQSFYRIADE